ncbi:sensor histidine kinase [Spirosoma arcticum]
MPPSSHAIEVNRLEALDSYGILDTLPEADYDTITQIAAYICQTPISLMTLLDEQRQWFKSAHGLLIRQTPREIAFCDYAIQTPGQLMEISDAQADERFAANPLVTGDPHIVFYAGVPLVDGDGHTLGTLCVIDHRVRHLSAEQATVLKALARQIVVQLQLRRSQVQLIKAGQTLQRLNGELHERNRVLKAVVDTCPVGIVLWQAVREETTIIDFEYVFTNPVKSVLAGLPGEPMPGDSLKKLFPEVVSSGLFDRLVDVINTGQPQHYEQPRGQLDHPIGWGKVTLSPCGDGVLFTAQDITHLKETENQLRIHSDTLNQLVAERTAEIYQISALQHAIVHHAGMAIASIDSAGLIQTMNPAAERLTGYSASELIGTSPTLLLDFPEPENQTQELADHADQLVRDDFSLFKLLADSQPHESIVRNKDGRRIPILLIRTPLHDQAGNIMGYVSMAIDVTTQKESELILEQSLQREQDLNKRKLQFITTASHEFRTPLTTIQSSVELVRLYLERPLADSTPAVQRQLDIIQKQIVDFSDLLSDVLSIGRIEAGRVSYSPQWVDMVALITEVVGTHYANRHDGRSVEVAVTGRPRLAYLDAQLITHVLINLLSNAFKFSTHNPSLRITFDARQVVLHVSDNGIGIPANETAQLFDTFFRASNAANVPGTGLGLVIARQFAALHGGSLTIGSEEHVGTTCTLTLPDPPSAVLR